jgi:hypothetical protein
MRCHRGLLAAAAIAAAGMAASSQAADVGVSISFSQPGVFGRVDIGQFPQPQVIVPQPVMVMPAPPAMPPPEPIYLWVPYEHRVHWDRHCEEYHACGHPVYFVNHVWYKNNVMARREGRHEMQERHEEHREAAREEHHDRGRHGGQDRREGHEGHEGHGEGHGGRGEDHDRGR